MEVLLLPQETAGACWISVGTVLQFRLQCHPTLSSALTFSFPHVISNSPLPSWHLFSLLLMDGFLAVWKIQWGVVTEPCQGDWQVCTYRVGWGIQEILMTSHMWSRRDNGFGRLRGNQNRFQPMSLQEEWSQSRVWVWCMGLLRYMKGRQRKMNGWTAMAKESH